MEKSNGWYSIHIIDQHGKERDVKVYIPTKEDDE